MSQIQSLKSPGPPNLIPRDPQTEHDGDASRLLLTVPLVLSYLILDDMYDFRARSFLCSLNLANRPPGRFALTRLPSPLLRHSVTEGLFNLLASTYERNYHQVYARARALVETLSADADLGIFGPSMIKSFISENSIFRLDPLCCLI